MDILIIIEIGKKEKEKKMRIFTRNLVKRRIL